MLRLFWHNADIPAVAGFVRYRSNSGQMRASAMTSECPKAGVPDALPVGDARKSGARK
jgi:hypothetical protein